MAKRKVCVVVNSRANYGRIKSVLRAAKNHPDLDLKLIVVLFKTNQSIINVGGRDELHKNTC